MLNFKCLFLAVNIPYAEQRMPPGCSVKWGSRDAVGEHLGAGRARTHTRAFSLAAVLQLSGQKEDGLLPGVSPGAQFRFAVLFQGDVPLPVLVFAGQVGVVVVLLQILQEVTFVCYGGLRATTAEGSFCWRSNWFTCICLSLLTDPYSRPSSFMAKYRPASVPLITTTPRSTALSFKMAGK